MRLIKIIGIIVIAGLVFDLTEIKAVQAGTTVELKENDVNKKPLSVEGELNSIVKDGINKAVTPKPAAGHDIKHPDPGLKKTDRLKYKPNTNVGNDNNKPVPAPIQPGETTECGCRDYHFVGFTSKTYKGDLGGIAGAADKCRSEYGEAARMCTTTEFNNRPPSPVGLYGIGWIQPDPVLIVTTLGEFTNQRYFILDKTGVMVGDNEEFSRTSGDYILYHCMQWSNGYIKYRGLAVSCKQSSCWFEKRECSLSTQIACCAP
jgi:hypothetical protein